MVWSSCYVGEENSIFVIENLIIIWLIVNKKSFVQLVFFSKKLIIVWFVLHFMKLLLCKDSKYSKTCLIKVLDSSPEYVRQYSFEYFFTLANRLLNMLLCNIVYFCRGIFNYSRCNITKLIDSVSTRVGEIISVLKKPPVCRFFR